METLDAEISKDASGRLTIVELPFQAREAFGKPKGTVFLKGTMNGMEYRSKLLSRGSGKFVMVLDKAMQKSAGFDGKTTLRAHFTMTSDDLQDEAGNDREPDLLTCDMDVLTAIKTRQSIRKFTTQPIKEKSLRTILSAGLSAPTAKNKRPYHFIVILNRKILTLLARHNPNAPMLESAACAIVVCGDKNREGMREFLYSDCAAATQNMTLHPRFRTRRRLVRRRGSFRLAETNHRSIYASSEVGTGFRHRARISERNKGIAPAMGSEKDSLRQMVTTVQSRPARLRFFNAVQERQHPIEL